MDKNLGPISTDKSDLIKECQRQLYDIITYNKISRDQAKQLIEKIKNVLRKTVNKHMLKGSCSKFEAIFFFVENRIVFRPTFLYYMENSKNSTSRKTYCSWLQLDFNSRINFCRVLAKRILRQI